MLLSIVAIGIIFVSAADAQSSSEAARAVVERTKTTSSTYTLYLWNRVTNPGEPVLEEGSAEFHKGDLHRFETPRDRIIADCRARTGAYLSVESGEIIEGPKVAAAACGINTNFPFKSVELLPDQQTKFGVAQRVRVIDNENIREYHVLKNGALVRTTYTENRPGGSLLVVTEAVRLEETVPDDVMFTRAALTKSYLPSDIKR